MEFLAGIHPKVVHFPIAFLMLYPLMELIFIFTSKRFFSKAAMLFLAIGVIGSLLAVLSGNQAFEMVNELDRRRQRDIQFSSDICKFNCVVFFGFACYKIFFVC
ncbi:MAG: hypothetical protein MZV64_21810 [Ignavibacteriales bacterium]|nr:hypothetical protein [Ignavibacteriales bacterium]